MILIQPLPDVDELPTLFKLGETNAEINIETAEENRNAALSLTKQACRNINIFSQDLDSALYDNEEFIIAASELAGRSTSTIIRILVQDSINAINSGHRLLKLAKSLPSTIFIRNPSRLHHHLRSSFLVADSLGFLYRQRAYQANYYASVNFMSPGRAATLDFHFMEAWEKSVVDRSVQRAFI